MDDANWRKTDSLTILDTPDYFADIDVWRNGDAEMIFVHLKVHRWAREVLVEMHRAWSLFRETMPLPVYALAGDDYGPKWKSFVSLFGFKPLIDCVCLNGERRCIYMHVKDNKNNGVVTAEHAEQQHPED